MEYSIGVINVGVIIFFKINGQVAEWLGWTCEKPHCFSLGMKASPVVCIVIICIFEL